MKNIPDYITLAEGGRISVGLAEGITLAGLSLTVAHMRALNAGDILDAQEEAERLVYIRDGGVALVMSPARMASASLRRQVARLEQTDGQKHDGPLSAEELGKFSVDDFARLQAAVTLLDRTADLTAEKQARAAEMRGRTPAGSGAHASVAGIGGPQSGD